MSTLAQTGLSHEELRDRFIGISPVLLSYIQGVLPRQLQRVISPEDVLQETFIKALRYKDSFQVSSESEFIRIAKLMCEQALILIINNQTTLKRGHGQLAGYNPSNSASFVILYNRLHGDARTPSRVLSSREAVEALQSAMLSLPQDRREAVHLRHIEGLSVPEIALRMKKTKQAIHGLLYNGLKQLKEELEQSESLFTGLMPHPCN